ILFVILLAQVYWPNPEPTLIRVDTTRHEVRVDTVFIEQPPRHLESRDVARVEERDSLDAERGDTLRYAETTFKDSLLEARVGFHYYGALDLDRITLDYIPRFPRVERHEYVEVTKTVQRPLPRFLLEAGIGTRYDPGMGDRLRGLQPQVG